MVTAGGHPDCRIPADVVAEVLGEDVARRQRNHDAREAAE